MTSWQRWMVCKPFSAKTVEAVRVFAETYRGAGPEPVAALNSPDTAAGLPKPTEPDPAAER